MLQGPNIAIVVGMLFLLIVSLQLLLLTQKKKMLGYILPAYFLFLAAYNLYKSLFVYNPYPTMAEGMLMTLGLFGFAVSGITLIIFRIYRRPNKGG